MRTFAAPVGDRKTKGATAPVAVARALRIGSANDALELEADRLADRVVQSGDVEVRQHGPPTGVVHRKCAGCQSESEDEETIRRRATADPGPGTAPDVAPAHVSARIEARRSAGAPLEGGQRAFFERRFGHDFGSVRVHADEEAGQLARAVRADAFNVGRDVYFAPGRFSPASAEGRRLLAHELAHVVQSGGAGPTLRRQESTTVEVVEPTGPTACTTTEHGPAIRSGFDMAVRWLNTAVRDLNIHLQNLTGLHPGLGMSPDFAVTMPTRAPAALQRHFRSTAFDTATHVRDRLDQIRTDLSNRADLQVECHESRSGDCHAAGAAVIGQRVVLCPSYFDAGDRWRASTLVHEFAHALTGGPHINDRAYQSDRAYPLLSTAEALRNAESYALLAEELGTRAAVESTAPVDTQADCPATWQPLIRTAIARGERWNRNAQVALADERPAWITRITPMLTTAFGAATPDVRSAALPVYDRVHERLRSDAVGFECEADATAGRCRSFQTYWYAFGRLHVCPSWRNLPSDVMRIRSLLNGVYGWIGGEGDDARRMQLVSFAQLVTPIFEPVV
jgi:hypothetical protein